MVISIVVAVLSYFILRFFNIGFPFIIPLIEGAIVGFFFVRLLYLSPNMSKNIFWALIGLFALTLYMVPQFMLFGDVNSQLALEGDSISFTDFLTIKSVVGSDFGRVTSSSSIHLEGIGYWFLQLVEVAVYGFGILWGVQKSVKIAQTSVKK